ncbi:MAG: VOC family protein [Legionellales bacterium]|nr:VOC family protein [Legionellales bacterium]
MSTRPPSHLGMRHVALFVEDLDACRDFYHRLLGLEIDWEPDDDNVYLSSGYDNVALHRYLGNKLFAPEQRLDHIGFVLKKAEDVEAWYQFLSHHHVKIKAKPRQHRDGTTSFYCYDPDGNVVQLIHIPNII